MCFGSVWNMLRCLWNRMRGWLMWCLCLAWQHSGPVRWISTRLVRAVKAFFINPEDKTKQLDKTILNLTEDYQSLLLQLEISHQKYENLTKDVGREISSAMSKDETKTENINRKCRPSIIREEYIKLSFQEASNIKSLIVLSDEQQNERVDSFLGRFFGTIYMVAGEEMLNLRRIQLDKINNWLIQPASEMWDSSSTAQANKQQTQDTSSDRDLPSRLLDHVYELSKDRGHTILTHDAVKTVFEITLVKVRDAMKTYLQEDHIESICRELRCAMSEQNAHDYRWSESLRTWIADVCNLSWQMTVQQPQMIFDTPRINEPIDIENDKIIPVRNMNFSEGMVISYYLEPNLMHGDKLLERGRIIPRIRELEKK